MKARDVEAEKASYFGPDRVFADHERRVLIQANYFMNQFVDLRPSCPYWPVFRVDQVYCQLTSTSDLVN